MIADTGNTLIYAYSEGASYPISFKYWRKSELSVYAVKDGEETLLLPQQYEIAEQGLSIKTLTPAPDHVKIVRLIPYEQDTQYINGVPINARLLERNLDRLTAMVQQIVHNMVTSVNGKKDAVSLTAADIPMEEDGESLKDAVDGKYEKPSGGIPELDLSSGVRTMLALALSAYQKPSGGVPLADLSTAVKASLSKADTALQDAPEDGRLFGRMNGEWAEIVLAAASIVYGSGTVAETLDGILEKIPAQASSDNKMADKAFVNSTVQTASSNFRGNWNTWTDVPNDADDYPLDFDQSRTPTKNDYLVVEDASGYPGDTLTGTWRFKYSGNWDVQGKVGWRPEYQVNETPLTAAQLAAINSGITAAILAQMLSDIQGKADDSDTVHKTGAEQIAGIKTFLDNMYLEGLTPFVLSRSGKIGLRASNQQNENLGQINISNAWYGNGDKYGAQMTASSMKNGERVYDAIRVSSDGPQYFDEDDVPHQINYDISIADYRPKTQQDVIDGQKVDKIPGKDLSSNDYSNEEKQKVADNADARHTHSNKSVLDNINTYLKNATLSEDEKTLTLTKEDGSTLSFQGGGGAEDVGLTIIDGKLCITYTE